MSQWVEHSAKVSNVDDSANQEGQILVLCTYVEELKALLEKKEDENTKLFDKIQKLERNLIERESLLLEKQDIIYNLEESLR